MIGNYSLHFNASSSEIHTHKLTLDKSTAPQVWELGPGPRSTCYEFVCQYVHLWDGINIRTYPMSSIITLVLYRGERHAIHKPYAGLTDPDCHKRSAKIILSSVN